MKQGPTFVDCARLYAAGGAGGNGCVGFRREKYVPKGGPDGGDGGRGGSVVLRADRHTASLLACFYAPHQRAGNGGHGRGKKQHGRNGRDRTLKVPCGTEVWEEAAGTLIADLVKHGDEVTVARGGRGGRGNCHWVTPTHRAPREHTDGEPGEERELRLELKLVADVGLVGYPNAGKSSLLRAISAARPKVAPYPFTTLHPVIGTVIAPDCSRIRVADIPGLIDGAHAGVGLGHAFLRHVERSAGFVFVLDAAGCDNRRPLDDYRSLCHELRLHRAELAERPTLIAANKTDLEAAAANVKEFVRETGLRPLAVSAVTGAGITELRTALFELVRRGREPH